MVISPRLAWRRRSEADRTIVRYEATGRRVKTLAFRTRSGALKGLPHQAGMRIPKPDGVVVSADGVFRRAKRHYNHRLMFEKQEASRRHVPQGNCLNVCPLDRHSRQPGALSGEKATLRLRLDRLVQ